MLGGSRRLLVCWPIAFAVALTVGVPAIAAAHPADAPITPANAWRAWSFEPGVVLLLAISAIAYAVGVARLWRAAGVGLGIRRIEAASFVAGWIVTLIALASPVDSLGEALFSAHMVQHELLMLVAAPLIVYGAPHIAFLWTGTARARQRFARILAGRTHAAFAIVAAPAAAWLLHAAAICAWHVPRLFDAAVRNDAVHAAQHLSFFGTAALFWWGLTRGRYGRLGYGAAVLYVFTTTMYTGLIGALMTIAPRPWYGVYAGTTAAFGLTPVEDQQLGGLVMWVPASIIYTAIGLVLFAMWLKESERRVRSHESRPVPAVSRPRTRSQGGTPIGVLPFVLLIAVAIAASACGENRAKAAAAMTGGDPDRGRQKLADYGCVTCHTIPGIREADALVGPPLTRIASRVYLAGHLPNTPDNMLTWIRHPRTVDPKTAMPDTGLDDADARDIAAYLYTLR